MNGPWSQKLENFVSPRVLTQGVKGLMLMLLYGIDMLRVFQVRTTPTPASHVTHPAQRKCITSGCSMFAHRGSLYCSQECIARSVACE